MTIHNSERPEATDVIRAVGLFHLKSGLFVLAVTLTTWWMIFSKSPTALIKNEYGLLFFVGIQVCTYYLVASYRKIIREDNQLKAVFAVFADKWPQIVILTGSISILSYSISLSLVLLSVLGGDLPINLVVSTVPIGVLAGGVLWQPLTGSSLRTWISSPEGRHLHKLGRVFIVITVSLTCIVIGILVVLLVITVFGSILSPGPAFPKNVGVPTGMVCLYQVYKRYFST